MDWSLTRIGHNLDWESDGRRIGELRLKPSDNARSLGYYPIPVCVLKNGDGPTLLLTGGTHGDEFEGPAALLRLVHELDLAQLRGRLIIFPTLNAPAVDVSTRCSPLDDGNLNRAFPGDSDGTATAQIANVIERVILPHCDAAIDIHSGGKASEFVPLAMFDPTPAPLGKRNHKLAKAFAPSLIWIMGEVNDNRSVNGAAQRQNIPMFATELGGGGNVDPTLVQLAWDGIIRVMQALTMWQGPVTPSNTEPQYVQTNATDSTLFSERNGLFVPAVSLGDTIQSGDCVGTVFTIDEIEREPLPVLARADGIVMCVTRNGRVARGDLLVQLGLYAPAFD